MVPTRHAAIMAGGARSSQVSGNPVDSDFESLSKSLSTQRDVGKVRKLLMAARAPISRADLLAAIGVGNESRNAVRNIEPLLAADLLTMSDPDNPRRRAQRYLTTDAGLEWLSDHKELPNQDY
jgi:hypothetical protein